MEITSITLSLSRPLPPSLPFSSAHSNFMTCSNSISLLNKTKSQNKSVFVVGQPRRGTRAEPAKRGLTCNALFGLGVPELVVIAGVAALVFGPKKLPEVGRSIGKTVKSFQQAAKEFESEIKKGPESPTEPSEENPTAVIEENKQDVEVSKESV
ncbi:PREDICTED: sec-independent protein translocase protein TATA, chloroplastic [Theobroma cacao]|uniref:Sec-independent protein translocase protein TATA, chloroplastic n=1 Tax=Theobroma cacao TaxID=3641 RepID=A0AB32V648_THECC|nr:PREDICTED: sec-independent protein translocase protein TATA, chloroplastic [Theobroma cacao]